MKSVLNLKNSKIVSTFPRQCLSNEGKTYIEKVTEPVDTSNWGVFNGVQGFTFKCPPSWNCRKFTDTSVTIDQNHYSNISAFQINLITPNNFQKSLLRHPSYNNPISWYNDLLAKRQKALQAPISTRIYRPGTDGYSDPDYAHYDLSKMESFQTTKGIIFPASGNFPDTNILIPLSSTDLVLVLISPRDLYKDPIMKAIISSINP